MRSEDIARFWSKVDVRGSNECWLWTKEVNSRGYGRFCLWAGGRKRFLAHRLAYCLATGNDADGRVLLHSCDNPPCCNPGHLRTGTQADNMADAKAKGRMSPPPHRIGALASNARLVDQDVREIRMWLRSGFKQRDVAAAYEVSVDTISLIGRGAIWTHVIDDGPTIGPALRRVFHGTVRS